MGMALVVFEYFAEYESLSRLHFDQIAIRSNELREDLERAYFLIADRLSFDPKSETFALINTGGQDLKFRRKASNTNSAENWTMAS